VPVSADGLAGVDVLIRHGRVEAVIPAGTAPAGNAGVDLARGQLWPCLIDVHTHLDKGHTWERAPNPDGTFGGALRTVAADRAARWSAEDVRRRMDFGLRCSFAHGTRAIRTHLDSMSPQAAITWPVFATLREKWAGRIELQAVSLVPLAAFGTPEGKDLADRVAAARGILGAVAFVSPEIDPLLDRLLDAATERGLDVDLHCDESGDIGARALAHIARAILRRRFRGRVMCGHCCSLAVQPPEVVSETLALIEEAGISVVSLPMCNLYLQDRTPARTPRWRGVTLLHELAEHRVPVAVASDNCRDAFHGYGDHDMLEVFREATRVCHLDRPHGDWPRCVTATPADLMGLTGGGRLGPGLPADLVLFEGRTWSELLSRPQTNRVVLRAGRAIDAQLPHYRELDDLLGKEPAVEPASP
jgi:cytosine deaminase